MPLVTPMYVARANPEKVAETLTNDEYPVTVEFTGCMAAPAEMAQCMEQGCQACKDAMYIENASCRTI